ncbi:DegT/DnrJ/EryC1/StrS family aminotransferase [Nitrosophilus kaiyonis]|uniref:DegT/DnrJ/EryC1/StrS family aminotransferase n=1 Tax=Nitrosophilus kaiyonis TaxID=2930200 RepID=UPI002492E2C4|nr:DegT/DnrJ/EryC1/StrS family aminotransferase [Nitrosophilus kaiyonis]
MKMDFIDLKTQYQDYKNEIDKEISEVLNSAAFIGGPKISELEKNLSEFTKAKYTLTCSSGTDALLLALMAIDIKEGDEVITTPFTFIATAEVIAFLKAKPVFVDIDEKTYNIDPSKIEEKITDKTKAIIPVSLYGQPADMDEINNIAKKYNLTVIEDGAQSFGAEYKGKKSCNLSHIGCTSFFPSKPLGCYGDGGAVFTNDEKIAKKIAMLKNHGQSKRYEHDIIGLNARLDAIQAAILLVKLKYFPYEIEKRIEIGQRYTKFLSDYVTTPYVKEDRTSVYAQYSIRVDRRKEIINKLNTAGIPTAIHYPKPLHLQKAFEYLGYKKGDFPVSEKISQEILSLPMSPFLKIDDQDYVINTLIKAL